MERDPRADEKVLSRGRKDLLTRIAAARNIATNCSLVNCVYNRIHELRLKGYINYLSLQLWDFLPKRGCQPGNYLEELGRSRERFEGEIKEQWGVVKPFELLEHLVCDSTYCYFEIVRIMGIYGASYMASHSMLASAHWRLADWCQLFCFLSRVEMLSGVHKDRGSIRGTSGIHKSLVALLGEAEMVALVPGFHRERALAHYRAALEVHSEGAAYREIIEGMHYLDEDFDDKLIHFCASVERLRINSSAIENAIREVLEDLSESPVYKPEAHFPGGAVGSGSATEGWKEWSCQRKMARDEKIKGAVGPVANV